MHTVYKYISRAEIKIRNGEQDILFICLTQHCQALINNSNSQHWQMLLIKELNAADTRSVRGEAEVVLQFAAEGQRNVCAGGVRREDWGVEGLT